MRVSQIAVAVVVVLLGAARGAWAAEDVEQAKKYYQLGTMNYDLGNYTEALGAFEKARELKPLPGFLFNIGQCHRRLGNHADAIRFYEQYLVEAPAAPNKADVDVLIAEERKLLASRPAPAPAPAPAPDGAAPPAEPLAPAAPGAPAAPPAEGDDNVMLWAAIGGGAAVALAGGAVLMALLPAPSKASLGRVDLRGAQ